MLSSCTMILNHANHRQNKHSSTHFVKRHIENFRTRTSTLNSSTKDSTVIGYRLAPVAVSKSRLAMTVPRFVQIRTPETTV